MIEIVHMVPSEDIKEHLKDNCWCKPSQTWYEFGLVHHAFDLRGKEGYWEVTIGKERITGGHYSILLHIAGYDDMMNVRMGC